MPSVLVGGDTFEVEQAGSGPPLLLVHGFPLDHTMWASQIAALQDRQRVIAPDLRGFGGSVVTPGSVDMARHADDLAALLDALGVRQPVVFCGFSMGGYVAWQFAQRHAARLAALVLCDTRAVADDEAGARGRLAMADRVVAEGAGIVADAMLPKLLAPATLQQRPDLVQAVRAMILRTDVQGIAAAQRGMASRPDVRARLSQLRVPTLAIVGRHDAIAPPAEMAAIAAAIPGARYVEIPDAGHMGPMENPQAVNAALREFLAELG